MLYHTPRNMGWKISTYMYVKSSQTSQVWLLACYWILFQETLFFSVKDSFSKWFIILEESWGKSSQNLVPSCIETTHPSVFHGIDFVLFLSEVKYMSLRSCKHYLDEINIWTVNNNIYYFFSLCTELSQWLIENKLVEHLFGPNLHVEVIW